MAEYLEKRVQGTATPVEDVATIDDMVDPIGCTPTIRMLAHPILSRSASNSRAAILRTSRSPACQFCMPQEASGTRPRDDDASLACVGLHALERLQGHGADVGHDQHPVGHLANVQCLAIQGRPPLQSIIIH